MFPVAQGVSWFRSSGFPLRSTPSISSTLSTSSLESVYTYEGTHDIHTLILGQSITGIPAYE